VKGTTEDKAPEMGYLAQSNKGDNRKSDSVELQEGEGRKSREEKAFLGETTKIWENNKSARVNTAVIQKTIEKDTEQENRPQS